MLFAGKYELQEQLGEGAMGVVYRARHVLLELDLAVKVLRPQYAADPTFRARFLREARLPHAFVHKRSVTLRDFGIDDNGTPYLTMDLCQGSPLLRVIKELGRLPARRAAGIACQVLEVLEEAHAAGILHRDIKPDNIMVDSSSLEDQVKVMDFGIAKIMEGDPSEMDLTRGGAIGTPLYMSPEQAAGERLDGRSDIYSLGVVLYEMLAGRPPFTAETVQALLLKHLTQPPPPIPPGDDINDELLWIVDRALAKVTDERFATALEFREALGQYLHRLDAPDTAGQTVYVSPTRPARPERGSQVHSWLSGAGSEQLERVSLAAELEEIRISTELPLHRLEAQPAGETLAPLQSGDYVPAALQVRLDMGASDSIGDALPRVAAGGDAHLEAARSAVGDGRLESPERAFFGTGSVFAESAAPAPAASSPELSALESPAPASAAPAIPAPAPPAAAIPAPAIPAPVVPAAVAPAPGLSAWVTPAPAIVAPVIPAPAIPAPAIPAPVIPAPAALTPAEGTQETPAVAGGQARAEAGPATSLEAATVTSAPRPHDEWGMAVRPGGPAPKSGALYEALSTMAVSPAEMQAAAGHPPEPPPSWSGSPTAVDIPDRPPVTGAWQPSPPRDRGEHPLAPAVSRTAGDHSSRAERSSSMDRDAPGAYKVQVEADPEDYPSVYRGSGPLRIFAGLLGGILLLVGMAAAAAVIYVARGGVIPPGVEDFLRGNPALMQALGQVPGLEGVKELTVAPAGETNPLPTTAIGTASSAATVSDGARTARSVPRSGPARAEREQQPAQTGRGPQAARAAGGDSGKPARTGTKAGTSSGGLAIVHLDRAERVVYVNRKHARLEGSVPGGGSRVSVNSGQVEVHDGGFSAALDLEEGVNTVTVVGFSERGSVTRQLEIVLDTVPPVVRIDGPPGQALQRRAMALVVGQVDDPNLDSVQLNGVAVPVHGGRFTMRYPLTQGENRLEVVAVDRAGNRGRSTVTVFRRPVAFAR